MIIFIHIPKSGGSTVGMRILNSFGEDSTISLARTSFAAFPGEWDRRIREGKPVLWVGGHVQYGIHHFLPIEPGAERYITFLRDPTELLISLYFFSRNNMETADSALAKELTLDQWLRSNNRPRDIFTYSFSGYFSNRSLALARENLFRRIEFFGLTEYFDESMAVLSERFNITATEPCHINRTRKPTEMPLSMEEIRAVVAKTDHQDVALYWEAVEVFHARYLR